MSAARMLPPVELAAAAEDEAPSSGQRARSWAAALTRAGWRKIRRDLARCGVPARDADDVTVEVVLGMELAAQRLIVPPWLTRAEALRAVQSGVVRRQAQNYHRAAREQRIAEGAGHASVTTASPEELALHHERLQLAGDLLAELHATVPAYAGVFEAHLVDGVPVADLAKAAGIPENTGWNWLRLARKAVATSLAQRAAQERFAERRPRRRVR